MTLLWAQTSAEVGETAKVEDQELHESENDDALVGLTHKLEQKVRLVQPQEQGGVRLEAVERRHEQDANSQGPSGRGTSAPEVLADQDERRYQAEKSADPNHHEDNLVP